MSYGANRWVSPYTFMGIRTTMTDRFRDPFAGGRYTWPRTCRVRRSTCRSGSSVTAASRCGRASTSPRVPGHLDRAPAADVACELLDATGAVLHFQRCRLRGSHVDPDGPHVDFHEALPWFDEIAEIRFLRNREVLHVHPVEGSAPAVELSTSELRYSEKPVTLSWAGRHPDRNLTYVVRYSCDGGQTWRVVAAHLSRAECRLRQELLPGGQRCVVQVVASSGIRTAVTQSKPFTAPLTPRRATILSTDVTGAGRIVLRGGAFSPDFGLGSPDDVTWSSNVDGLLGHGLVLVGDRLVTEGLHAITLTAPDGMGGLATTTTPVTITARY